MKGRKLTEKFLAFLLAASMLVPQNALSVLAESEAQDAAYVQEVQEEQPARAEESEEAVQEAEPVITPEEPASVETPEEQEVPAEEPEAVGEPAAVEEPETVEEPAPTETPAAEEEKQEEVSEPVEETADQTETKEPEITEVPVETPADDPEEIEEVAEEEIPAEEPEKAAEETFEAGTLFQYESGDHKLHIEVTASEAAQIPADAVLHADYLAPGTANYENAVAQIEYKKGNELSGGIADAVFDYVLYDLYFTSETVTGEIQPQNGEKLKVTMTFNPAEDFGDAQKAAAETAADAENVEDDLANEGVETAKVNLTTRNINVAHVSAENEVEIQNASINQKEDGSVAKVEFYQGSFSPTGLVRVQVPEVQRSVRKAVKKAASATEYTAPYNLLNNANDWLEKESSFLKVTLDDGRVVNIEDTDSIPEYAAFELYIKFKVPSYEESSGYFDGVQNGEEIVYPLPGWVRSVDITSGEIPGKGTWEVKDGNVVVKFSDSFLANNHYGAEGEISLNGVMNAILTPGSETGSISIDYLGEEADTYTVTKRKVGLANMDLAKTWTNNVERYVDSGFGAIKKAQYVVQLKAGQIGDNSTHNTIDLKDVTIYDFFETFEKYDFDSNDFIKNDDLLQYISMEDIKIEIESPDGSRATVYENGSSVTDKEGRSVAKSVETADSVTKTVFRLSGNLHPDDSIYITYNAFIDEEMYEHNPHGAYVKGSNNGTESGDASKDSEPGAGEKRWDRSWLQRRASNTVEATTSSLSDGAAKDAERKTLQKPEDNDNWYLTFDKTWIFKGPDDGEGGYGGPQSGHKSGYQISVNEGNLMPIGGYVMTDNLAQYDQELITGISVTVGGTQVDSISLDQLKAGGSGNWAGSNTRLIKYTFPSGAVENYRFHFMTISHGDRMGDIEAKNGATLMEAANTGADPDTYGCYKNWTVKGATVTKKLVKGDPTTGLIRWQGTIDDGIDVLTGSLFQDFIYWEREDQEDGRTISGIKSGFKDDKSKEFHNFGTSTNDLNLVITKGEGEASVTLQEGTHYEVRFMTDEEIDTLKASDASGNGPYGRFGDGYTGAFEVKFLVDVTMDETLNLPPGPILLQYDSKADFSKVGFKCSYKNQLYYRINPVTEGATHYDGFIEGASYNYEAGGSIRKKVLGINETTKEMTDSNTYTINWEISVNESKMETQADLIIRDTIPEGLTFDLADLLPTMWEPKTGNNTDVFKASFSASAVTKSDEGVQSYTGSYFDATYNTNSQELEITIHSPNQTKVVFQLPTMPTAAELARSQNDGDILEYENTAHLFTGAAGNYHMQASTAKVFLQTEVMSKAKAYDQDTAPYVVYKVKVNKGGAALSPDTHELIIEDSGMQDPIVFVQDSLKVGRMLNQAVEGDCEWYTMGDTASAVNRTYTYEVLSTGGFRIVVPDEVPIYLEYKGYAPGIEGDKLNTKNSVKLYTGTTELVSTEAGEESEDYVEPRVNASGVDRVTVRKEDKYDRSQTLSDAEFTLYRASGDDFRTLTKVGTFTSDGDGKAYTYKESDGYAHHELQTGVVYVIKETKAPAGYLLDTAGQIRFYFIPGTPSDSDLAMISTLRTDNYADVQLINAGFQDFIFDWENEPIATMSLPVEKTWASDVASDRPESITFTLYYENEDGEMVPYPNETSPKTLTITADDVDSDNANQWNGSFEDIPITDGEGNPIKYSVVETAIAKYTSGDVTPESITYDANSDDFTQDSTTGEITYSGDPFAVTNTKNTYNRGIQGTIWLDNGTVGAQSTFTVNEDEPLEGITVYLYNKDDELKDTTTTNRYGNYYFSNLDAGTYEVRVDYNGYVTGRLPVGYVAYAGQGGRIDSIGNQVTEQDWDEDDVSKKGAVIETIRLPDDDFFVNNPDPKKEPRYITGEAGNPFYEWADNDKTTAKKDKVYGQIEVGTIYDGETYIVASQNVGFVNPQPHKTETKVNNAAAKVNATAVAKTDDAIVYDTTVLGDEITYKITYVNPQPTTQTVIITDKLDTGVDYVSDSATQNGNYDEDSRTITWEIPTDARKNGTVEFKVTVNSTGRTKGYVDNDASVEVGNDIWNTEIVENPVDKYTRSFEGIVWYDIDKDGKANKDDEDAYTEDLVEGVKVYLYKLNSNNKYDAVLTEDNEPVYKETNANGHYSFADLEPGTYKVVFDDPRQITGHRANGNPTEDQNWAEDDASAASDIGKHYVDSIYMPTDKEISTNSYTGGEVYTTKAVVNKNFNQPYINLGVIPPVKSLSGKAWFDNGTETTNKDGKLDSDNGDEGISDIPVMLTKVEDGKTKYAILDTDGLESGVAKVTGWADTPGANTRLLTNTAGDYKFTNLDSGDYSVIFEHDAATTEKDTTGKGLVKVAGKDTVTSIADARTVTDNGITKLQAVIAKATIPSDNDIVKLMRNDDTAGISGIVTQTTDGSWEYELPNQNAGFIAYSRSISGYAWQDTDVNSADDAYGILGTDDYGLNDITVKLQILQDEAYVDYEVDDVPVTAITKTNGGKDGYYEFTDLPAGTFRVVFKKDTTLTHKSDESGDPIKSIAEPAEVEDETVAVIEGITLPDDAEIAKDQLKDDPTYTLDGKGNYEVPHQDAGFVEFTRSISGNAWKDNNVSTDDEYGTKKSDDKGIEDIDVILYKWNETSKKYEQIDSTKTKPNGDYSFEELEPGEYKVVFETGLTLTKKSDNSDGSKSIAVLDEEDLASIKGIKLPSDGDIAQDLELPENNRKYPIDGKNNFEIPHLDAGFVEFSRSISGYAWQDKDVNSEDGAYGVFGEADYGLNDITVKLQVLKDGKYVDYEDENGPVKVTTATNENTKINGYYEFTNLPDGTFRVVFEKDTTLTSQSEESGDTIKSIAKSVELGASVAVIEGINLPSDTEIAADLLKAKDQREYSIDENNNYEMPHQDAGFVEFSRSISGKTWFDENRDGTLDEEDGDYILPEIPVTLKKDGKEVPVVKVEDGVYRPATAEEIAGAEAVKAVTDKDGNYKFIDLEEGTYSLEFDDDRVVTKKSDKAAEDNSIAAEDHTISGIVLPSDEKIAEELKTNADYVDEDGNYEVPNQNMGVLEYSRSIDGVVWLDGERDGSLTKDNEKDVLQKDVEVVLYKVTKDESGTVTKREEVKVKKNGDGSYSPAGKDDKTETAKTDENGFYSFTDLEPGDYEIEFNDERIVTAQADKAAPDKSIADTAHKIAGITLPSDDEIAEQIADAKEGDAPIVDANGNYNVPDQNMGLIEYTKSVSGTVWLEDLGDDDGSMDEGEKRLEGITVTLTDKDGKKVTTKTDKDGHYEFKDVPSGDYSITFDTDKPVTVKTADGVDDAKNSKVVRNEDGTSTIEKVTVPTDEEIHALVQKDPKTVDEDGNYEIPNQNAGLVQYSRSLDGIAWLDRDKDGKLDDDERLLGDTTVNLYRKGETTPYKTVKTDENGYYSFTGLEPGDYEIEFVEERAVTKKSDKPGADVSITETSHRITGITLPTDDEIAADSTKYPTTGGNYHVPYQNMGVLNPEVPQAQKPALQVTKKLELDDGTEMIAQAQTFYVALFADAEGTRRLSDVKAVTYDYESVSSVIFDDVDSGETYYVKETDAEGNIEENGVIADAMYAAFMEDGGVVTIAATGTTEFEFTNVFVDYPSDGFFKAGSIDITKKVLAIDGKAKKTKEKFYAGIFADKEHKTLSDQVSTSVVTLDPAGESTVTVSVTAYLNPDGDTRFYIAETTEEGKLLDDGFAYTISIDHETIVLNEENLTAEVTITNTEIEEETTVEITKSPTATPTPAPARTGSSGGSGSTNPPKTGDDSPIAMNLMLLLLALGTAAALLEQKKRRS